MGPVQKEDAVEPLLERTRLLFELPGGASLHRLEPGLSHADAPQLPDDVHQQATARLGGDRAALAQPVLLAEQAATLDLVSGGRLDFGIGKGFAR